MDELTLKVFVCGQLANNCYLVYDDIFKKGFIIDKPSMCTELDDFIKAHEIDILFVALTHGHFDHIEGLINSKLPFYVHSTDAQFLKNPKLNGSAFFGTPINVKQEPLIYKKQGILEFCEHKIKVVNTPGHTPGSVSLSLGNWLFSGDALFCNSIGRTDIPLASGVQLVNSIKEKLLILPDDTIVYPGHGPTTTIGQEKANNPYL